MAVFPTQLYYPTEILLSVVDLFFVAFQKFSPASLKQKYLSWWKRDDLPAAAYSVRYALLNEEGPFDRKWDAVEAPWGQQAKAVESGEIPQSAC